MAFRITGDCIECLACLETCPHQAISQVHAAEESARIAIDPSACTHCWPFDQRSRCVKVCPVDCIVIDADRPVPPVWLIRRQLEELVSVAGPFEAVRMIIQVRQWVREWFADAARGETAAVDIDQILDFYSFLSLMEKEFSPGDAAAGATKTSRPAGAGLNA